MASHRKPRPRTAVLPGPRTAIGLTSAALATVTLLSENASAAPAKPAPTIAQVQAKVDSLNHQAEVATQRYNQAKVTTDAERQKANRLLNQVASGAQRLNNTRQILGRYAAEQYRDGGLGQTATFLLSADPQDFFDQAHAMKQATATQDKVLTDYETQMASTARQRTQASSVLRSLTTAQQQLATDRRAVQDKLRSAQDLLNSLTAAQKARLAKLQAQKEAAARASAAKLTASAPMSSATYAAKAAKAIAFAKAQLGKPYVWGATGPNSYDCSGLTQAAWAAAGVTLPRTTWDQVKVGTRVSISDLEPGDLIFYYSDISHVAMYIGNGQMIQAPHTGAVIDIQPITEMPIYGATRPA
jgi:peptidoglycan DL-endopeptidase CwlO